MNANHSPKKIKVRTSLFPISLMFIYFGIFLLMSGLHTGLLVLIDEMELATAAQPAVPILYWLAVAAGLTIFTRYKIKKTYEIPVQRLAEATSRVAHGDFSVYVPTVHTPDKLDYLDVMIQDFNHMVESLGSIETLKTDFFSNVSHEIKTPIAVIQNTAELMRSENISPQVRQEYVETIIRFSKRLSSLITNILKLSKLEKQTITPDAQTYDLPEQLADCALQFEQVWEEKNIDFIADLEDHANITADPSLMELVWNNLLSNAFKFTEPGQRVTLTQTTQEDTVTVQVADTGCGMDAQTLRHIFDKFYQGDSSHATEGNGLGLALVRRIIQLTDADISVESSPGSGTIFTVKLRQAKPQADAPNELM